jgi:hypothetical protein
MQNDKTNFYVETYHIEILETNTHTLFGFGAFSPALVT